MNDSFKQNFFGGHPVVSSGALNADNPYRCAPPSSSYRASPPKKIRLYLHGQPKLESGEERFWRKWRERKILACVGRNRREDWGKGGGRRRGEREEGNFWQIWDACFLNLGLTPATSPCYAPLLKSNLLVLHGREGRGGDEKSRLSHTSFFLVQKFSIWRILVFLLVRKCDLFCANKPGGFFASRAAGAPLLVQTVIFSRINQCPSSSSPLFLSFAAGGGNPGSLTRLPLLTPRSKGRGRRGGKKQWTFNPHLLLQVLLLPTFSPLCVLNFTLAPVAAQ